MTEHGLRRLGKLSQNPRCVGRLREWKESRPLWVWSFSESHFPTTTILFPGIDLFKVALERPCRCGGRLVDEGRCCFHVNNQTLSRLASTSVLGQGPNACRTHPLTFLNFANSSSASSAAHIDSPQRRSPQRDFPRRPPPAPCFRTPKTTVDCRGGSPTDQ